MKHIAFAIAANLLLATPVLARGGHEHDMGGKTCESFGPQTPRDIDNVSGENAIIFNVAPAASNMNLCNIHFHRMPSTRQKISPSMPVMVMRVTAAVISAA